MMQTLKEIDATEATARTRAWKFGRAKEAFESARARLRTIEAKLEQPDSDLQVLQLLAELAPQVPAGIMTRGSSLQPGGANLRDLLVREISGALDTVIAKRQQLEAELPLAKQRFAEAQAALASFGK